MFFQFIAEKIVGVIKCVTCGKRKASLFNQGGEEVLISQVTFVFMSHMTFWEICCFCVKA